MAKRSAGILVYRLTGAAPEVFLVHPGGPYWVRKDDGAWTIPKGEIADGEEPLAAAQREFQEETGFRIAGDFRELGGFRQPSGKTVFAWAIAGNVIPEDVTSTTFTMEWPPRSGQMQEFPEVDRAGWFTRADAERKILKGQALMLEVLWRMQGWN
ncbi:NUDIX domain-containing protein [Leptospira interrogans]